MRMYHSLHGNRYRDRNGKDVWADALKYLGGAIRRKHGLIWIDGQTMVPDLPSPYKPIPKMNRPEDGSPEPRVMKMWRRGRSKMD